MFRKLTLFVTATFALSGTALAANPFGPGWEVIDTSGNFVGYVVAIDGDTGLVVRTDKHDVKLPVTSFRKDNGKLLFAMTQEALNAKAVADQSLNVGKPIKGTGGAVLGTVEAVDNDNVTMKLTDGRSVKLPRNGVTASASGATVGISQQQLQAYLATSGAASATTAQ